MASRQYDVVLFGAAGFTGRYTAEHITNSLPTDLRWAIAGRSSPKLQALAADLKQLNSDRLPPALEVCSLDPQELDALAKKTTILVTTVGPYAQYGTPVVEACVNNGTHYFDVTGETPWVYDIVKKYHDKAQANEAIIIPQIGIDSAPADLVTWTLVTHIKNTIDSATGNVYFTLHKLKGTPSGGTLASLFGLFESFSLKQVQESIKPWSLSPIPPNPTPPTQSSPGLLQTLTGVHVVPDLGTLTTSLQGAVDRTQVYRSWALLDKGNFYGKHFRFHPFMTARNWLQGILIHFSIVFGSLVLLIGPLRKLLQKFVYKPGEGPTKEESANHYIRYHAIAEADSSDPAVPKRAFASLDLQGSAYHITGVFLAEATISLLRDDSLAKQLGGGVLTPATLGGAYIERLQKAGLKFDVRMLP